MKKLIIFGCMILGSCVIAGCGNNTTANVNSNDSVIVDSIDSVIVDSTLTDTISVCND